jgi:hypothetical protein
MPLFLIETTQLDLSCLAGLDTIEMKSLFFVSIRVTELIDQ